MANTRLEQWALPRLQQLLPLDDDSLKQVVQYADSLPKDAAAEHLKNLLGDDARALEFISSFNLRRKDAPASSSSSSSSTTQPTPPTNHGRQAGTASPAPAPGSGSGAGSGQRGGASGGRGMRGRGGKKRANIHALPARQVEGHGNVSGGYVKSRDEGAYVAQKHKDIVADKLALREKAPDATQMPLITDDAGLTNKPITSKQPPSAAGPLVSDSLSPRKAVSAQSSRSASPAPKTKVNISGGTPMHGASSTLSDLDSAIRSLEIQTNPALSSSANAAEETERRKCNCMATRHPLLEIAPNCLNCGKIICVKQGLGPCTSCNTPLLTPDEITKVLRVLKDERGEEKMKANNATHKKPDISHSKTRALTGRDFLAQATASSNRSTPLSSRPTTPADSDDEIQAKETAKQHRDRLLNYQSQNARRTQIHDEAADYDVPASGTSMWASPAERAQQLKRQQRVLRENEWNSRPEWEKRRVVASIDLKGGRVVRKMAGVERPQSDGASGASEEEDGAAVSAGKATGAEGGGGGGGGGGAFSRNPLAKGLIKPQAREAKGKDVGVREKGSTWRRVQMDEVDNEAWILDGGVYGGETGGRVLGDEERAFG